MFILIALIIVFVVWLIIKPYVKPHDTVELWVGTNGSGKSLFGVKSTLIAYRKNCIKVFWHNILHPFDKWDKPIIFSSIPLYKGNKIISYELKPEHLVGAERLPPRCVCFLDEVSIWLSQMDYNNKNVNSVDNMATLFRHYTFGGYLIMTTQDINKCAFPYRYCTGSAFVLSDFKKHWWGLRKVASSSVRRISINGDIQAVELGQKEENEERIYTFLVRRYDTYAFSNLYKDVPNGTINKHTCKKVDKVLKCPKNKIETHLGEF